MLQFSQQHEPSPYDGIPTPGPLPTAGLPSAQEDTVSLRSSNDSAGSLSDGLCRQAEAVSAQQPQGQVRDLDGNMGQRAAATAAADGDISQEKVSAALRTEATSSTGELCLPILDRSHFLQMVR